MVLLVILIVLFYFVRSSFKTHEVLLTAALLVTLLVSPYLYNYDFLLLLVPFAVLVSNSNFGQKIGVLLCYLASLFALVFYGRAGNISLIMVSMVMIVLLFIRAKNPVIDFTGRPA